MAFMRKKKEAAKALSPALEKAATMGESRSSSQGYKTVAVVYLLGLFMGAIDMSIVNPARTVIQNSLSVPDELGVWIMTIYTLAYAASIPVMGKLADRHGRKNIYLVCVLLFGLGSLLCGLSQDVQSFQMLIASRALQAIGGGGIVPVATAEFGTAFPEEKRGMALGLVGGVYGIASVFGASAGSLILDIAGQDNWQFIFYVNVPICIAIILIGLRHIPNTKIDQVAPIDGLGITVMTAMVLSLMYGLKNIDFFDLADSITQTDVYPFLIVFVVLLPIFILVERRAVDPVMNLAYFKDRDIVITLICSIMTGVIMMGILFVPQFCENMMFMKSGSGGYFLMLLGVFTGIGSPVSGKIIDKAGVKPVLAFGFAVSMAGALYLGLVTCAFPTVPNLCISLALEGLGMGFIMGTPLNYMMLSKTDDSESNSALATLSLVRSIGTAVAPAIMVAFIAHAGLAMQDNIMAVLPTEVSTTPLPHAQTLDKKIEGMRKNEDTKKMLEGVEVPSLESYATVKMDMSNAESKYDVTVSDEMKQELQDADVTTIVGVCKDMSAEMYGQIKPQLEADALEGIDKGLSKMKKSLKKLEKNISKMESKVSSMHSKENSMRSKARGMDSEAATLHSKVKTMQGNISSMKAKLSKMKAQRKKLEGQLVKMKAGQAKMQAALSMMPAGMPATVQMQAKLAKMKTASSKMQTAVTKMKQGEAKMGAAVSKMQKALAKMKQGEAGIRSGAAGIRSGAAGIAAGASKMQGAVNEMKDGRDELSAVIADMQDVKDAVPSRFDEGGQNYLAAIDERADQIQKVFQDTLNGGFKGMFFFVAACSGLGLLLLLLYRDDKRAAARVAKRGKKGLEQAS